jgi:uncharacterized protein DUF6228
MSGDDIFVIHSVHGGARLEFRGVVPRGGLAYEGFTLEVRLSGGAVEASESVHDHLPHRWTELFDGLARDWRGWEGVRTLVSLESQLEVSCSADRLGHVSLRVELSGDHLGSDWRAADTIYLEAGQLEDLARRARGYFGDRTSED